MNGQPFDLLVIGGGINGVGIARDAAGRGLSVALVEQGDLGRATSSASSKLIHGGLRYLEQYEFRLVREALMEREVLLSIAPHIVRPMEFILPHDVGQRSALLIRAGLFLYDHLARRKVLAGSRRVNLEREEPGAALAPDFRVGFSYSDCWVDDARLVVLNALDAKERGADIRTGCRFISAAPHEGVWKVEVEDDQGQYPLLANVIVNAAGPWVEQILAQSGIDSKESRIRLIQGSHIVVPRNYAGEHAYILQNPDGRIVFIIPYEHDFTLIGTTDVPFQDDPSTVSISTVEINYLCDVANRYLRKPIGPDDVLWSYSGVRPLFDDQSAKASTVTRDYVFDLREGEAHPPLLSIYGGKITTYRRLAEHAMQRLKPHLARHGEAWTSRVPLPGGDLPDGDFPRFLARVLERFPFLPAEVATRLSRAYGTRIDRVLGNARSWADLGEHLGGGLTACEVDYLVREEFARTADDILWRRGKFGLHGGKKIAERLAAHLAARASGNEKERALSKAADVRGA
ncbi:MAG: glycerol-3-phosphate dehydrogenase [Proteobacteria bacterium]|nr:glycerol-3-phosphate dehydrogenase [Pseudomonadota bacterium]